MAINRWSLDGAIHRAVAIVRAIPILLRRPRHIKYFGDWQQTYWRSPIDDRRPWLSYIAIDWLKDTLRPGMKVIEFGSGGSTLFFAERVAELVSVEHDREWYFRVQDALRTVPCSGVTYVLKCPLSPLDNLQRDDEIYYSHRFPNASASFKDYASVPDAYPDNYFDLALVDGRVRNACVLHVLPKIKDGGWLILDDSQRADYATSKELLSGFSKIEFFGLRPYWGGHAPSTAWHISRRTL